MDFWYFKGLKMNPKSKTIPMKKFYAVITLSAILFSCNSEAKKPIDSQKITATNAIIEKSVVPLNTSDTLDVHIPEYFELDSVFMAYQYDLDTVRKTQTCPRIFIHDIRHSLGEENLKIRKHDFIEVILPNALAVNDAVLIERENFKDIESKTTLSAAEEEYLNNLLTKYRAKSVQELDEKINIIPPSLIICQAIIESGWGKSHFAYEGNSLFGEHAPADAKDAMKAAGANIGLRAFPSVYKAIESYVHNLNSHPAYKSLRDARSKIINSGQHIDGLSLAQTQDHYSEKGHEYAEFLMTIIKSNELQDFDACKLTPGQTIRIFIEK